MDHITQVVMALVRDMGMLGYWVAFIAALAETLFVVGLLLPGSIFLLLMGVLSGQGVLDLGDLLVFAIAGAALGDNINYHLGRKYGKRWLSQERWFLKPEYLSKANHFFANHGGKSVFLGRFVPSVKELMPFIAGMAEMERWSFLFWNLLGAIGWALQWILPGYIFSQSLSLAQAWLSRIGFALVALVALFVLLYLLRWVVVRFSVSSFRLALSVGRSIAVSIRDNPNVVSWSQRHPRLALFLRRRVDTSRISGLPMSLIVLSIGYILLLFGGLVEDLLLKEAVVTVDSRIDNLLASLRTPLLNHLFYGITTLGNTPIVVASLFLAVCVLWWIRRARFILPMLISVGVANGLTFIGKFAFHRPRPEVGLIDPGGFSFPSGHATTSVAFYGFLFFTLIHFVQSWRTKGNLFFVAALLITAIGFSRMYLGVHYLSDVLAGYLVGAFGLLLGIALTYTGWSRLHLRLLNIRNTLPAAVLTFVATLLWFGSILHINLHQQMLVSASDSVSEIPHYHNPGQLLDNINNRYSISVIGTNKSPINLVFETTPEALQSCLKASGWHLADQISLNNVVRAYLDVFLHRSNSGAPFSPWFWQDSPQFQQWSRPDSPNKVFDRYFLRIWKTSYKTPTGLAVYTASTGHEFLPKWRLVPQTDLAFDDARAQLISQLRSVGGVVNDIPLTLSPKQNLATQGLVYEGGHSAVTLRTCQHAQ